MFKIILFIRSFLKIQVVPLTFHLFLGYCYFIRMKSKIIYIVRKVKINFIFKILQFHNRYIFLTLYLKCKTCWVYPYFFTFLRKHIDLMFSKLDIWGEILFPFRGCTLKTLEKMAPLTLIKKMLEND